MPFGITKSKTKQSLEPKKPAFNTCFYVGAVSHRRISPVSHRFSYRVFSILIDLDELPELDRSTKLFSHNRPALMGFYDIDHGPKDGSPLKPWIRDKLREGGQDFDLGTVKLLCFPRLFGMVFNPISVWYCYDADQKLRSILYEVRNTFGQWRGYLLAVDETRKTGEVIRQSCDKTFYVSPFMDMDHRYNFTLHEPDATISIGIRETKKGERCLLAVQTGKKRAFTPAMIKKTFAMHPLLFVKVVTAIHFEAARLLIKGAKFHLNPQSKNGDVTFPD